MAAGKEENTGGWCGVAMALAGTRMCSVPRLCFLLVSQLKIGCSSTKIHRLGLPGLSSELCQPGPGVAGMSTGNWGWSFNYFMRAAVLSGLDSRLSCKGLGSPGCSVSCCGCYSALFIFTEPPDFQENWRVELSLQLLFLCQAVAEVGQRPENCWDNQRARCISGTQVKAAGEAGLPLWKTSRRGLMPEQPVSGYHLPLV